VICANGNIGIANEGTVLRNVHPYGVTNTSSIWRRPICLKTVCSVYQTTIERRINACRKERNKDTNQSRPFSGKK